jgi:hypothetical protein
LPSNPRPDVREAFDRLDKYDEYTGRLGNLTLLEKTINASVSNPVLLKKLRATGNLHFFLPNL